MAVPTSVGTGASMLAGGAALLAGDPARTTERNRIAREMHDVLAHRISLVAMQAGVLGHRADLRAEDVAELARGIAEGSRQALEELRDVLGVLRACPGGDLGPARAPSLERVPELVVAEAADGDAAVARERPDVVLVDARMPGRDGLSATAEILTRPDPPAVLVLTTFDSDEPVLGALRAGALGFVLKDTPPARIAEAVRTAAAGEPVLSPQAVVRLIAAG